MSTITLEVTDELLERIRAKAQDAGQDSNVFAVTAIVAGLDTLEGDDPDTWYASLSPERRAAYDADLDASLADSKAGRVRPFAETLSRLRAQPNGG